MHDPYKITESAVWAKIMTDAPRLSHFASDCFTEIAVGANFVALILTFAGAAYHAYGYVQLRNAQKQALGRASGHLLDVRHPDRREDIIPEAGRNAFRPAKRFRVAFVDM